MKRLASLLASLLCFAACANFLPASDSDTFATLDNATAMLSQRQPDGSIEGICTAFAFRQERGAVLFATAAHCVLKDEGGRESGLGMILKNAPPATLAPVEVVDVGDHTAGGDWAILRVTTNRVIDPLKWGNSTPGLADRVFSVSVQDGIGRIALSGGVVSRQIGRMTHSRHDWTDDIFLSLPVIPGNSGSPVWSGGGVVGIVIGRFQNMFAAALPWWKIPAKWRK